MQEATAVQPAAGATAVADSLIRIHGYMKGKRQPYEPLWRTTCGIFAPELTETIGQEGIRFGADVFDGYPALAMHTWANGIVGNMIYPESKWLNIILSVRKLMEDDDIKAYLQNRSEQTFWAAGRTNFYKVNPAAAVHAAVMGAYLIPIVDRDKRSVHFYLEDPWSVWIEVDLFGNILRLHREVTKTVQAWADEFGANTLPADWQQCLQGTGNPYTERTAIHCLFKNPNYDRLSLRPDAKRWASVYVAAQGKHIIQSSGLDYGPIAWFVYQHPRWIYPVTPAMRALTDALGSDVLSETLFQVARLAGDPQMKISDTLRALYEKGPGGLTYVARPDEIVEQVHKQLNWGVPDSERARVKMCLDRWFGVEFFMILSNLTGQPPTAFHIQQLQGEKATLLGPQVGSYQCGVLDPSVDVLMIEEPYLTREEIEPPASLNDFIFQTTVADMRAAGMPVNEANFEAWLEHNPIAKLEAQYTGLLTQIQSTLIANRGYVDGVQFMTMIANLWPEAKYIVDEYQLGKHFLESRNFAHDDMRSAKAYKEIIQQLQEREDLAEQAQTAQALAKTYQGMSKAPEQGSPGEMAT